MTVNKAYAKYIIEGRSPQDEIVSCLLSELEEATNSTQFEQVRYTASPRNIQEILMERGKGELSLNVIGRTIQVFLDFVGLKEGKDYTKISGGGCSSRYHLNLRRGRIIKLKEVVEKSRNNYESL